MTILGPPKKPTQCQNGALGGPGSAHNSLLGSKVLEFLRINGPFLRPGFRDRPEDVPRSICIPFWCLWDPFWNHLGALGDPFGRNRLPLGKLFEQFLGYEPRDLIKGSADSRRDNNKILYCVRFVCFEPYFLKTNGPSSGA